MLTTQKYKTFLGSRTAIGPLLFALYVNELPYLVSSSLLVFADDIKLYRTICGPEDCSQLQEDINTLQQWSDKWLLSFNVMLVLMLPTVTTVHMKRLIYHYRLIPSIDTIKLMPTEAQFIKFLVHKTA